MKTTKSEISYEYIYLLRLICSVVNRTNAEIPEKPVNWRALYGIAAAHSLSAILYEAVEKLPSEHKPDDDILACLAQLYREQMVTDINLTVETERLLSLFAQNGIEAMAFKGIVTKNDYPKSYLRTMSDIDILIKDEDRDTTENILLGEGYKKESVGFKDSSFRKDGILHFEIHTNLLEEDAQGFEYFSKIWDRAEQRESKFFVMSLEDTYLFMLEHLANHLLFGGAGLRMYLDVYLFNKNHKSELKREYVDFVLSKLNLAEFERETLKISENFFSPSTKFEGDFKTEAFILSLSTFGSREVYFAANAVKSKDSSSAKNGIKLVLGKVFPSFKALKLKYRAVKSVPVLYPVFIPVFWFERAFIRRNINMGSVGSYFESSDSQKAKELKDIYISLGLEKRL